jgi:two-component SAPR family response regulator
VAAAQSEDVGQAVGAGAVAQDSPGPARDQLWPGLDADAARNNPHQVLHAARRALSTLGVDGASALTLREEVVVLGPNGQIVTDIEEFQEAVQQASASQDATALAAALGRWRGELLPEDVYEPWAQQHADHIREWRTTLVNGFEFTAAARTHDPRRLLRACQAAAVTLNLARAFTTGRYADLRLVPRLEPGLRPGQRRRT